MKRRIIVLSLCCIALILNAAPVKAGTLSAGETFFFGSYEQDNDLTNGAEPIEWMVLESDGEQALLLSRYGLDAQPYHTEDAEVTWETCSLRQWLNGDFLNAAFTREEQARLLIGPAGDPVFLLDMREKQKYLSSITESACLPTAYAVARNAWVTDMGCCCWWLRWDKSHNYAPKVESSGKIGQFGDPVYNDCYVVRPAVILRLTQTVPDSSAEPVTP